MKASHRRSLAVRMHRALGNASRFPLPPAASDAPRARRRPVGMAARLRKMEQRRQRSLSVRIERHRQGGDKSRTARRPAAGGDLFSIEDLQRSLQDHDDAVAAAEGRSAPTTVDARRRKRLEERRSRIEELRKGVVRERMDSDFVDTEDEGETRRSEPIRYRGALVSRLKRFKVSQTLQ